MIRYDDTPDEFIIAVGAFCFYVLGGIFAFIGVMTLKEGWSLLVFGLSIIAIGGLFNFIKVSTDGRVRWQEAERKHQERLKKRRESLGLDKDSEC